MSDKKCTSCKKGKFDYPKDDCTAPEFHWLRAGTKWERVNNAWKPVVTAAADAELFGGLLVRPESSDYHAEPADEVELKLNAKKSEGSVLKLRKALLGEKQ